MKMNPFSQAYGIEYEEGDVSLERVPFLFIASQEDVTHIVRDDENIFMIAHKYFNNSGSWSVIADANGLSDVSEEVTPGMELIIPNGRS